MDTMTVVIGSEDFKRLISGEEVRRKFDNGELEVKVMLSHIGFGVMKNIIHEAEMANES